MSKAKDTKQTDTKKGVKFSPGEWKATQDVFNRWHVDTDFLGAASDYAPIADVRPQSEAEANAHLLAASPDMYAALKALSGFGNPPFGAKGHIDYVDAKTLALLALVKAEGRE